MLSINISSNKEFITGTANGTSYSVTYSEDKLSELQALADTAEGATSAQEYREVVDAFLSATKEDHHQLVLSKIPSVHYNPSSKSYHLKAGEVKVPDAMPQVLVDRLLYSVEVGIPTDPLIKFYTRLLRNPNYSPAKAELICGYVNQTYTDVAYMLELIEQGLHEEVAKERATQYQTPISVEGLLATYKYATVVDWKYILDEDGNKKRVPRFAQEKSIDEDTGEVTTTINKPEFAEDYLFLPPIMGERGDAFYSGDKLGHFIRVGEVHSLPSWDMIDCDDSHFGVPGLHNGNRNYVTGYGGHDRKLLEVLVSPENIGAVVGGSDGAIRVKEYFVYGVREDDFVNKSIYHSSAYGKKTDEQWEELRAQVVADMQQELEEVTKEVAAEVDLLNSI